jgi:uncharacterized protein with ACT and thioredoxin-like domain
MIINIDMENKVGTLGEVLTILENKDIESMSLQSKSEELQSLYLNLNEDICEETLNKIKELKFVKNINIRKV